MLESDSNANSADATSNADSAPRTPPPTRLTSAPKPRIKGAKCNISSFNELDLCGQVAEQVVEQANKRLCVIKDIDKVSNSMWRIELESPALSAPLTSHLTKDKVPNANSESSNQENITPWVYRPKRFSVIPETPVSSQSYSPKNVDDIFGEGAWKYEENSTTELVPDLHEDEQLVPIRLNP
jgi:hypothetical protein